MSTLSQVDCQGEAEPVPDPFSSSFRELVVTMTMANRRSADVSFEVKVSLCARLPLPLGVAPFPAHWL